MNMPYPHTPFCEDHTCAADDYDPKTGETDNPLPLWMRITAVGKMPWRERAAYMGAEPQLSGAKAQHHDKDKLKIKRPHRTKIQIRNRVATWVRTGEKSFEKYPSLVMVADTYDLSATAIKTAKRNAKKHDLNFFTTKTIEIWIVDPSKTILDAVIMDVLM